MNLYRTRANGLPADLPSWGLLVALSVSAVVFLRYGIIFAWAILS